MGFSCMAPSGALTVRVMDAVEERARFVGGQHAGFAALDDVLGAAYRGGRIDGDDMAGDQPVEQHADGGQVLLDGRLLGILAWGLDVGGDVQRLDVGELAELVPVAPGEELADGMRVGLPGVAVADAPSTPGLRIAVRFARCSPSSTAETCLLATRCPVL